MVEPDRELEKKERERLGKLEGKTDAEIEGEEKKMQETWLKEESKRNEQETTRDIKIYHLNCEGRPYKSVVGVKPKDYE